MKVIAVSIVCLLLPAALLRAANPAPTQATPKVVIETIVGDITIELFPDLTPITVDNFLYYVNSGFYDGLIIHRVLVSDTFRTMGGGAYLPGGYLKTTGLHPPIINESYSGLKNLRGTIAMARSVVTDPNSAKSEFFINALDHPMLDPNTTTGEPGFCVFGQVISGMDIVDEIINLPVLPIIYANGLPNCPYYDDTWVYTFKAQIRVYVANNGNDASGLGDPCSPVRTIQKGIDLVQEPGHVVVTAGTYTGAGNRNLDLKNKEITVRGPQPRDADTISKTVLDCQGSPTTKRRAFYVRNTEGPNSVIQGFTIVNGYHDDGGAIYCASTSPTIRNCTVIDNTAINNGGGIYGYNSDALVINCTLATNTAARGGGICFGYGSDADLMNSILWNNSAPSGHEIAIVSAASPSTLTVTYTDAQGGLEDIYAEAGCSAVWGLGNFDLDPCFVNPGADDYHLQSTRWQWVEPNSWVQGTSTSPCIDAGNPGTPPYYEFGSTSVRVNMGAYGATTKASIPPQDWGLLADIDNDGYVDLKDFAHLAALRSATGQNLAGDLTRNLVVNLDDLDRIASGWLRTTTWYWPDRTDINNDKVVSLPDFSLLGADWLDEGEDLAGDVNGDMIIDAFDVSAMSDFWLQPSPR